MSITDGSPDNLVSGGFGAFLAVKVLHTKSTVTNVPDIFINDMKLFQDDVGGKRRTVKL